MNSGGVIQGGWGYVIAVYAISAIVYFGYAIFVIRRDKDTRSSRKETR